MDAADTIFAIIGKVVFGVLLPTSVLALWYGIQRGVREQQMAVGTGAHKRLITGSAARRRGVGFIVLGTLRWCYLGGYCLEALRSAMTGPAIGDWTKGSLFWMVLNSFRRFYSHLESADAAR